MMASYASGFSIAARDIPHAAFELPRARQRRFLMVLALRRAAIYRLVISLTPSMPRVLPADTRFRKAARVRRAFRF